MGGSELESSIPMGGIVPDGRFWEILSLLLDVNGAPGSHSRVMFGCGSYTEPASAAMIPIRYVAMPSLFYSLTIRHAPLYTFWGVTVSYLSKGPHITCKCGLIRAGAFCCWLSDLSTAEAGGDVDVRIGCTFFSSVNKVW